MPLLPILFLMLACAPVRWPEPVFGPYPTVSVAATLLIMLAPVVRSLRLGTQAARLVADPVRCGMAQALMHRARARQTVWVIGCFAVAVLVAGWGWAVQQSLVVGDEATLAPGAEIVLLAPFFLAWAGSWLGFYVFERRLGDLFGRPGLRLRRFCIDQFRQQWALAALPVALILLEQTVMRWLPHSVDPLYVRLGSVGLVIGLLATAPWSLRWLLGLQPLPVGPLRDRLETAARRMRFRYSDFLVWDTRGLSANAMIAGLLPRPRYVLFTDQLLHDLNPEEIEAVLGHEMGHVRAGHLVLYTAFLGLSLVALGGAGAWLQHALGDGWLSHSLARMGEWQALPSMMIFGVYVLVAFGFLSRRCEREADLYGCRAVSCGRPDCDDEHDRRLTDHRHCGAAGVCTRGVDTFVNALERVADANGICRSKPGWLAAWRHDSIARRVEFLERVRDKPDLDIHYRRRLRVLKFALLGVLIATVATLGWGGYLSGFLA